jgi:signal transduction histidine kinase
LTVLVADDIASSRLALAELVASFGYVPVLAASGTEALQRVQDHQPDILLLDLLMPDLDGFEVTRLVRAQVTERWLPVIVTSSLQGDEHFIHALSRGADDYLCRPVNPPLLEAKLRHYQWVLGLQARLAALAQRQHAIHDSIADAVITVDAGGRISEVNRAARQLLPAGEPVGQPLRAVIGIDLQDLQGMHEFELTGPQGVPVPMGVSVGTWSLDQQGFTTLALHDLTERRRIERMKDEFLATVSHELRTPLTSVLGAMGLLASGAAGTLPAPALELTTVARRNGERLRHLIDDVLDLTKLEGNRMVLRLRNTDLNQSVTEAIAAIAAYAQDIGVTLDWHPLDASPRADIDPDRLLQVMANLLSNAVKHSVSGQQVHVALQAVPEGWRIDVRDAGPGIDPAFKARLFEKFAQADSSDRRTMGGTGLGLYISRLLVERMGGRISAVSIPGQGATFSVVFPASRPAVAAEPPPQRQQTGA